MTVKDHTSTHIKVNHENQNVIALLCVQVLCYLKEEEPQKDQGTTGSSLKQLLFVKGTMVFLYRNKLCLEGSIGSSLDP